MALVNGTGIEIHGRKKFGHKHKWDYVYHDFFGTDYECKCGARKRINHSPDGYIGNEPNEIIFEPGSCYFRNDRKPCNDMRKKKA